MKTFNLSLIALAFACFCTGSLQAQNLTVEGRVGIGTDTPTEKLQVEDGFIKIVNNFPFLRLQSTTDQNAGMEFLDSSGDPGGLVFYSFPSKEIVFMNQGVQHMFIEDNGEVGIGTNEPQSKLHITGGTDVNSTDGGYLINGELTGTNLGIDNNEIQARDNGAASTLFVNVEGGSTIMNRDDGNVGIGTASPSEKLHIVGNSRIQGKLNIDAGATNVIIGNTASPTAAPQESVIIGFAAGNQLEAAGGGQTFVGKDAGRQATTGIQNVAMGLNTGEALTTQDYGTYVGSFTASTGGVGDFNTKVGYNINSIANFDNSTALGSNILVSGSNKVVLGNIAQSEVQGYVNFSSVSDGRFKKNVKENVRGLDFILDLRPVTYQLDAKGLDNFLRKGMKTDEQIDLSSYNQALQEKANITYTGFIAQEVEEAAAEMGFDFSGIVKPQNGQDHYGLRYAEFVVPLVKGMQEQQEEIEELKNTNEELRTANLKLEARLAKIEALLQGGTTDHRLSTNNLVLTDAKLEQNQPNPFNGSTVVRYFIPESIKNAVLRIMSIDGKVVKEVVISARGEGQTIFDATTLSNGNYQYSLFLDGELLDTKQMVLTKN